MDVTADELDALEELAGLLTTVTFLGPFCAISANPAEIAESTASDATSALDAASALDELPPLENIRKIPNTIENQYRNFFLFNTEHSSKQI
ncbi:hypothetical protein [Lactobacillus helveticus]|uniref:hypothetical protein n=1 Tax=Lactobacillus helveticus TaxID=1587 RepID=UPI00374F4DF6